MTGAADDRSSGERGVGDATWHYVVLLVQYATAGVVGNEAHRLMRRVKGPSAPEPSPLRLTKDEAVEWAAWMVEEHYLDTSSVSTPKRTVVRWSHDRASGLWTLRLRYKGAGEFDVQQLPASNDGVPTFSVSWTNPSAANRGR